MKSNENETLHRIRWFSACAREKKNVQRILFACFASAQNEKGIRCKISGGSLSLCTMSRRPLGLCEHVFDVPCCAIWLRSAQIMNHYSQCNGPNNLHVCIMFAFYQIRKFFFFFSPPPSLLTFVVFCRGDGSDNWWLGGKMGAGCALCVLWARKSVITFLLTQTRFALTHTLLSCCWVYTCSSKIISCFLVISSVNWI